MTTRTIQTKTLLTALFSLIVFAGGVLFVEAQLNNPSAPLHVGTCADASSDPDVSNPCQYKTGNLGINYSSSPSTSSMGTLDVSGETHVRNSVGVIGEAVADGSLTVGDSSAGAHALNVDGTLGSGNLQHVNSDPVSVCANGDGVLKLCSNQAVTGGGINLGVVATTGTLNTNSVQIQNQGGLTGGLTSGTTISTQTYSPGNVTVSGNDDNTSGGNTFIE